MQQIDVSVQGHNDENWSDWLGALTIARRKMGNAILSGTVRDRPALRPAGPDVESRSQASIGDFWRGHVPEEVRRLKRCEGRSFKLCIRLRLRK